MMFSVAMQNPGFPSGMIAEKSFHSKSRCLAFCFLISFAGGRDDGDVTNF